MKNEKTVEIQGRKVIITKKHIKNMYLRISNDGTPCVSCPNRFSDERVIRFVEGKMPWIEEKEKQIKKKKEYISGELLPFFGKDYELEIKNDESKKEVKLQDGKIIMSLPENCSREEKESLYYSFLKLNFEKVLPVFIEKCEKITGLKAKSYKIRKMESRYGSCSTDKKTIRLSVSLAKFDAECIEYVLLHELTHLQYHGHGKDFYSALERFCPDMKRTEEKLKKREKLS